MDKANITAINKPDSAGKRMILNYLI